MNHLLFLNIGGSEFILIALVILIFFGAKGVPDIAKSLGRATREFKDAMNGIEREIRDAATPDAPKPNPPVAQTQAVPQTQAQEQKNPNVVNENEKVSGGESEKTGM